MPNHIIQYIFMMISNYGAEQAAWLVNQVLTEHNTAVTATPTRGRYAFTPDHRFSDSQCVLHGMLDKSLTYKLIHKWHYEGVRL